MKLKLTKEIRNGLIIAGIFLCTQLLIGDGTPTRIEVFRAVVGGLMTFLIELANTYGLNFKDLANGNLPKIEGKKNNKGTLFF